MKAFKRIICVISVILVLLILIYFLYVYLSMNDKKIQIEDLKNKVFESDTVSIEFGDMSHIRIASDTVVFYDSYEYEENILKLKQNEKEIYLVVLNRETLYIDYYHTYLRLVQHG